MRLLLLLVSFLFCCAIHANPIDSTTLNEVLTDIDHGLFAESNYTKDIPHFIKAAIIRKSKADFRITDHPEKFNAGDCGVGVSEYHRLLGYVAHTSRYYIITYIKGGFASCPHVLLIEYSRHRVSVIYNFMISYPKNIGMLAKSIRAPNFRWDYLDSF